MLVDIDMLSVFSDQIFVERPGFAFIVDIEFEKLIAFCSSCKMIHDISKYGRQFDSHNKTTKSSK